MASWKRSGAYLVILEPGNDYPVYVSAMMDTGGATGAAEADTGSAYRWIAAVKAKKFAEGTWVGGDTGYSDTGYPQLDNKGTVLDMWLRYDSGAGAYGDWDKRSVRVTK